MAGFSAHEAWAILETRLPPGSLNAIKEIVFEQSWAGRGYGAIAETAGYDADYVRESGSSLWRSISELLGEKVTKRNFRALLLQRLQEDLLAGGAAIAPALIPEVVPATSNLSNSLSDLGRCDWGEAPDVTTFYGREAELAELRQAIARKPEMPCRLVAVLGLGGMGKTHLVTQAAQRFQGEFDRVVWRSLRNAPFLTTLVHDLLAILSDQQVVEGRVTTLLNYLRRLRCLVILDNVETVLEPGTTGVYRSGYEDYGNLLRTWGEVAHRSCLLLTSREKPPEVALLEGEDLPVKVMILRGAPGIAQALIRDRGLQGTEVEQQALARRCGDSPLAIKLVATSIRDLFGGEIAPFLAEGLPSFEGLRRLIAQQMERLSPLEHRILTWLAINRQATSLAELDRDLVPKVPKHEIFASLEALTWRSLVEIQAGQYSLQPVLMDYLTAELIDQVCRELAQADLSDWLGQSCKAFEFDAPLPYLYTHVLVKAAAPEHIRQSQRQLIVQPTVQRLRQVLRLPAQQRLRLQALLKLLKGRGIAASGYVAGNLLTLAIHLDLDLAGLDCSRLTFRQMDLRRAPLQRVNFSGSEFWECVFTQGFGSIFSVDHCPVGDRVASGDSQGQIQLWDGQGQLLHTYGGHRGRIHSLTFSPDGQLLATGGDDGQIRIWNVDNQTLEAAWEGHQRFVWSLAWSPDGTLLASGGGDRRVRLWDTETGDCLKVIESASSWIQAVAFHPEGTLLATGSDDCAVRLWDIPSGQYLGALLGHDRWVCTVAFSPDGTHLASGSHDRTVRIWDVDTGSCLQVLKGHTGLVRTVLFSPEGSRLASTSSDQSIRLWDATTFQCLRTLTEHIGWVQDVAFSPNGQTLVSGGHDQTLRRWDLTTGACLDIQVGYVRSVRTVDWQAEGRRLATCSSDHAVRLWSAPADAAKLQDGTIPALVNDVTLVDADQSGFWIALWSPGGNYLATGSKDHRLRLWDSHSGRLLQRLEGHSCWVCALRFSPDGTRLVSGSSDRTLRIWEVATGQCLQVLTGHSSRICSVAFSPDGRSLVSGGADYSIRLWDGQTGDYQRPFQGHQDLVTAVRISPDNRLLASGSLDGTLKLWDLATGTCLTTLEGYHRGITGLAWNPQGAAAGAIQLCTCGTEGQVLGWAVSDLLQGETRPIQQPLAQQNRVIWDIAFRCDGQVLAGACDDGTTLLWACSPSATGSAQPVQLLIPEGPYEQMQIAHVQGLTEAQRQTLERLGATSEPSGGQG